jgi:hypothetical protein
MKFYTFANNRDRENCFLSLNAFQKRGRIIVSVAEFSAGWPESSAKSWQHCFSQVKFLQEGEDIVSCCGLTSSSVTW